MKLTFSQNCGAICGGRRPARDRWRSWTRGIVIGLGLAALCGFRLDTFAAPPAGYYQVWSDEFDGASLDASKWHSWATGKRRDAVNTPAAVSLNGSNLVVTTFTSNNVHYTGGVAGDGKFTFRQGYAEASIAFSDTNGMWSAFWMMPPTMGQYIGDPGYAGTEIDICEHLKVNGSGANIDNVVQSTVHWDGYGADHKSVTSGYIGSGLNTGFHTYALKWTATNCAFLIDGAQKWAETAAVSQRSEYFILSSEVQSNSWAGTPPPGGFGSLAASTTRMLVDYVRYYAPTTTVFWTGGGSAYWADPLNWIGGWAPQTGNDIVFSYLSTNRLATLLGQGMSVNSLALLETAGPVSISGASLTVGAGGIDLVSAQYDLTLNSPVTLATSQTWRVGVNRNLIVNGPLQSTNSLALYGYGAVQLAAGAVVNLAGTLSAGNGSYGRLVIQPGAQAAFGNVFIGNPANFAGDVIQQGGNVTITNQLRIGHWPNESSSYQLQGGTLTLSGTPTGVVNSSGVAEQAGILYVGIDGTGAFLQTGGVAGAAGIVMDGRTETPGTDTFTLTGGRFNVGAWGVKSGNFDSNVTYQINLGGGTIGASASWASSRLLTLTGTNGNTTFDTGTNTISLTGAVSGPGGLIKQGTGTLALTGSHSFTGNVAVNGGVFQLSGNSAGGGAVAVGPAGAFVGDGTNAGPVTVNGALTLGAGVGQFTTGSETWNGGGRLNWHLADATTDGSWSQLNIQGALNLAATPADPFIIAPVTWPGGAPGAAQNFDSQSNYQWIIVNCAGGITGFDPAGFQFDASGFSNSLAGGAFTVATNGNSLVLKFNADTFPPAFAAAGLAAGGNFHFSATGVPGKLYRLETAASLAPPVVWNTVTNLTADDAGNLQFGESLAPDAPARFFRLAVP